MVWRDLLFAHWPVASSDLRRNVSAPLEIEEFDGTAWVGIIPFSMTGIRPRGLPPVPGLTRSLELNVRTYVRFGSDPGVWFFSLDAESPLLVAGARAVYHLNYLRASMSIERRNGRVHYSSRRTHSGAPEAQLECNYSEVGPVCNPTRGTLEDWLTGRYLLYAADSERRLYRARIHHDPWPLQPADADFPVNTMAAPLGLKLEGTPLLHYSKELRVLFGVPQRFRQ